ncbi:MAG: trypsin-like serine protease [Christensenellales bacterium]
MQVKHVLRGFSVLTFVLVILAVMISPYSAVFAETGMDLSQEIKIIQQHEAALADSDFTERMYAESSSSNISREPDYYAGHYYDDTGVLHICFAKSASERMIDYQDLLQKYKGKVTFECRDFSFNELCEYADQFAISLKELGCTVYSWGPEVEYNMVIIFVSNESYELALSSIASINTVPNLEVQINTSEAAQLESGTETISGDHIIAQTTTGSTSHVTLAATGKYNGQNAFLTCGHTITSSSSFLSANNATFGTTSLVNYSNNGYGDFAIGYLNSNFNPSHRVRTSSTSTTLWKGYALTLGKNKVVKKYGYNSGLAYANIVILSISESFTSNGTTTTIKGLVKAKITSGSTSLGDSGGPYWLEDGNLFCGVHSGRVYQNGELYVYFTPYKTIKDSGFTVNADHTGTYTYHNTTNHKNDCTLCGHVVYEPHTCDWDDYNSTYHKGYCSICNTTVYEPHSAYYSSSQNKCTRCGRVGNITTSYLIGSGNVEHPLSRVLPYVHN